MKKFTHTAIIKGKMYNRGAKKEVKIRYTNSYIIDEFKTKYKRYTGNVVGARYHIWQLDLSSIKELNND
ncbi:hypothetical protein ACOTVP_08650 [Aliarcobacter butzleri]